eukprot:PLAT6733.2.p1 GENE.PLAT6733.2~~PLAT6733.2.p1  ORF type:complete len:371 (+),score=141.75 PLAT6733.2:47-1159(+)
MSDPMAEMMAEVEASDDEEDAPAYMTRGGKTYDLSSGGRGGYGSRWEGKAGDGDDDDDDDDSDGWPDAADAFPDAPPEVSAEEADRASRDSMRSFLFRPVAPDSGMVQCYVIRNRGGKHMMHALYSVYLEDGDRFLMSGKKRMKNKTSNYLISMDDDPTDRSSDSIVGKLRANFVGSSFTIYDYGMSPERAVVDSSLRREMGVVVFEYDRMGPGRMEVAIPRVSEMGVPVVWKPREDEDKMISRYESKETERMTLLRNKRPKWDEAVGGHVLNFHGRVTKSSVKNFQMASDLTGDETVLQFGRVGRDKFSMDFAYPLSPMQAFAICLASLDGKLADSKSFEKLRTAKRRLSSSKIGRFFGGGGGSSSKKK